MRTLASTTPAALWLLALLALVAPLGAQTWPTTWRAVTASNVPVGDPCDDENGAQNERDIIGDATFPSLQVGVSATDIAFRMRVAADPRQGGGLRAFAWALEFGTDLDHSTYEWLVLINGVANPDEVELLKNSPPPTKPNSPTDPVDSTGNPVASWAFASVGRTVQADSALCGDQNWFIDLALPKAALTAAGIDLAEPLVL